MSYDFSELGCERASGSKIISLVLDKAVLEFMVCFSSRLLELISLHVFSIDFGQINFPLGRRWRYNPPFILILFYCFRLICAPISSILRFSNFSFSLDVPLHLLASNYLQMLNKTWRQYRVISWTSFEIIQESV